MFVVWTLVTFPEKTLLRQWATAAWSSMGKQCTVFKIVVGHKWEAMSQTTHWDRSCCVQTQESRTTINLYIWQVSNFVLNGLTVFGIRGDFAALCRCTFCFKSKTNLKYPGLNVDLDPESRSVPQPKYVPTLPLIFNELLTKQLALQDFFVRYYAAKSGILGWKN